MNLKTIIKNHQTFSERILSEIQNKPFGSLPKVELELVILDALIKALDPTDSYSNLEKHFNFLQRELRLTQTQLKNKILAAQLRFDSKSEKDVEKYILNSILSGKYTVEGGYIVISIFNPLLNDLAKSYIETRGIISDASFNKSILKISLSGFVSFLFQVSDITADQKLQLEKALKSAQEGGLIKLIKTNSKNSKIEQIETVTAIGSNIITILEKVTPFILSLL
jgi:hypothetical protein